MLALITQSNYIPWKGYFDAIARADVWVVYDDMQYTRRDWRNRNRILTPQGPLWLTLPVKSKGRYFGAINQMEIADPAWAKQHWQSILHAYRRAPAWHEIAPWLEETYQQAAALSLLSEVNVLLIRQICNFLKIFTEIRLSSAFELSGDKNEKLIGICRQLGADSYLSGPAARSYLNESAFQQQGIRVQWMDYSHYPEYPQASDTFIQELSVLDLLFNTGASAAQYMKYVPHEPR